jgi:hypothetical protein
MDSYESRKEELKSSILREFANVTYPGDDKCIDKITYFCEVEDILKYSKQWNGDWRGISYELLYDNTNILYFLSSDAYIFFLPAFLLSAVDRFYIDRDNKRYDFPTFLSHITSNLCNHNDPTNDPYNLFECKQQQRRKLSQNQKQVINNFLRFVVDFSNDNYFIKEVIHTLNLRIYDVLVQEF